MTIGEVKAQEVRTAAVPLESKPNKQSEFIETILENEVFVEQKLASNLPVKERFSRLKKSLRKKSVSIF